MPFTNVHLQPPSAPSADSAVNLPRLRFITNDPAREYAQRPGEVERLPDSVAALILCKQGFSKVGRNGIRVEGIASTALTYWSEHSITIATKAGTNEKVLWTVNRHQPEILHILSHDGEYIESIPIDGKVPWFDAAATQRELGAKRRSQNRSMQRVRMLHAPDAQETLARETHNAAEITGLVQTFPTGDRNLTRERSGRRIDPEHTIADREPLSSARHPAVPGTRAESNGREAVGGSQVKVTQRSSARGNSSVGEAASFPIANRIHEAQRAIDSQRAQFETRQRTIKRRVAEVSDADLADLTDDDDQDRTPVAAITATENQSEAEDLSELIL